MADPGKNSDKAARADTLFGKVLDMDTVEAQAFLAASDESAEIKSLVANLLVDDDAATEFMASRAGENVLLDLSANGDAQASALSRGVIVGRYVILDTLGSGGMGIVYSAYDPELDRKIAIKLLRADRVGSDNGSDGQARLLREARALARLSHPNVLPIFDVGRFDNQVFLAMEYVEGKDLRAWLDQSDYSWREILAQFVAAGQGLAAAHGAGVIHRDFKPQNVMIGDDGQVRVMDFGLARSLDSGGDAGTSTGDVKSRSDPLASNLTQAGSLLGTPVYMSPEQLKGEALGAASDQFSFAVALFQSLYGVRPFAGKEPNELLRNIEAAEIATAESSARVPAWLRRALSRALHYDPDQRFTSIQALLDVLRRDPARQRNWWLGSVIASFLVLGGTYSYYKVQTAAAPLCKGARAKMAAVWNPGRKAEIEAAFLTNDLAYAADTWATVERQFDQYSDQWSGVYTQACEATHIHGEQSAALLDLRMACLEGRRQEFNALAKVFAKANADVVTKAAKASGTLSAIENCSDTALLTATMAQPTDPAKRQLVAEVESILADAEALNKTGQYDKGRSLAASAMERAEAADHLPTLAHVNYVVGQSNSDLNDAQDADQFFRISFAQAIAGKDDRRAAKAAVAQVFVFGLLIERLEESKLWEGYARALLERIGGDQIIEADLASYLGTVLQQQGYYEEAHAYAQQVLDLRLQIFGPNHERVAAAMVNLANAKRLYGERGGSYDEIIALLRRAHQLFKDSLGPKHPLNAVVLNNLGGALQEAGKVKEAYTVQIQALELARAGYGNASIETAIALQNLSAVEVELSMNEDSLAHVQTAIGIVEDQLGSEHSYLVDLLTSETVSLKNLGRYDEALVVIDRGLSLIAGKEGKEHARSIFLFGQAQIALDRDNNSMQAYTLAQTALSLAELAGPVAATQKTNLLEFLAELSALKTEKKLDVQPPRPAPD